MELIRGLFYKIVIISRFLLNIIKNVIFLVLVTKCEWVVKLINKVGKSSKMWEEILYFCFLINKKYFFEFFNRNIRM